MSAYIWSPTSPAAQYDKAVEMAAERLTHIYRGHCRRAGLSSAASAAVAIKVTDEGDFDFHVPDMHRAEYDRLEFGTADVPPRAFERQFSTRHAHTASTLIEKNVYDLTYQQVR